MSSTLIQQRRPANSSAAPLDRLSVVVPCHNEAAALEHLAASLGQLRHELWGRAELELLLVDDGSTDDTAALMKALFQRWDNVRIIHHPQCRGIAAAIATGLAAAGGEVVASLDADCTYDPLILVPMLRSLAPDVDLVVASPYHPRGHVENVPAWRLFISQFASRLYRVVMHNKLHTYTSCVRVYRRRRVVGLPVCNPGFVGVVELLWQIDRRGGKIVEVPAVLTTRKAGVSKMRVARATLAHLRLLSRAAMNRVIGPRPPLGTRISKNSGEVVHT